MERDRFYALIREVFGRTSRCGVMRAGLGMIATNPLTATGLAAEDAATHKTTQKRLPLRLLSA